MYYPPVALTSPLGGTPLGGTPLGGIPLGGNPPRRRNYRATGAGYDHGGSVKFAAS